MATATGSELPQPPPPPIVDSTTTYSSQQRPILFDLPNETLLSIASYVPFESGSGIITLRLVNRQMRELLMHGPNLQQLRNGIAKKQYTLASAFYKMRRGHTWESLKVVKEETNVVDQMLLPI